MGDDVEKGDGNTESKDVQNKPGMSQSSKDDIGVCVTILAITFLAIIVTTIKIVIIDSIGTLIELPASSTRLVFANTLKPGQSVLLIQLVITLDIN